MKHLPDKPGTAPPNRTSMDYDLWRQKTDWKQSFRAVVRSGQATTLGLVRDISRLHFGAGGITPFEYFRYRLYAPSLSMADKLEFLSDRFHWSICDLCSDPHWRAVTEDKWLSYTLLGACGVPVPETVAIFDPTIRSYEGCAVLRTAADLKRFLTASAPLPLIVKPNDQLASFGVFAITGLDGDHAILHDHTRLSCDEIVSQYFGGRAFIFQAVLRNHPELDGLAPHLATLRLINLVTETGASLVSAVLKIPSATNIADNFWRPGNGLGQIDLHTGTLVRVVRGTGPD